MLGFREAAAPLHQGRHGIAMSLPKATRRLTVNHRPGLHARPSLAIVKTVQRFRSKVRLRNGHQEADASDLLQILSMGVPEGAEVVFTAEGPDAELVLEALARLFADDFEMS